MNTLKVVLWDIDGTLLDFHAAESAAIRSLFQKYNLGCCTDEMLHIYSAINATWWKRLEQNEVTKPQVLIGRFLEFFEKFDLNTGCAEEFNADYQLALGDTIRFCPGAMDTVLSLKGCVLQCAVTNGTKTAQDKKLANSGLGQLFDAVFISDEIGIEKPNPGFFHAVFEKIGKFPPKSVMIIGDSLTSDIQGGINVGIRTCWYNPHSLPAPDGMQIDHIISNLSEVLPLCNL